MKFSCYKNDLVDALSFVARAAEPKPQTPILSGVLLNADSAMLEL